MSTRQMSVFPDHTSLVHQFRNTVLLVAFSQLAITDCNRNLECFNVYSFDCTEKGPTRWCIAV